MKLVKFEYFPSYVFTNTLQKEHGFKVFSQYFEEIFYMNQWKGVVHIWPHQKSRILAQTWLCAHDWCQSWLICFQPIVMKFGMGLNNDCASIYISKNTQMLAQTWLCMHEWCQSWLMTSCFQPFVMKFGMWVYNDCENNIY